MNNKSSGQSSASRARAGARAGIVGIAANLVLFAAKLTIGLITSSVSAVADAVNNLSDAGSSIIVTAGYIISEKPADRKHPYGHARIEYLSTLFISVIISVLGIELLRSSVESLISGGTAEFSALTVIVMAVSIAVKLALAAYFKIYGRRIGSDSLAAAAADSLGDVAASCGVIIGALLAPVTGGRADGVLGCLIALYILLFGVRMVISASNTLLGAAPSPQLVRDVIDKLRSYDGVLGIHDLVLHDYGEGRTFASVHLEVDADEDVMKSHDMIDNIECEFARDMNIHLVIHMDPVKINDERVSSLRSAVLDIIEELASELSFPVSMHDFRAVFGVTHTNLIFDIVVSDSMPVTPSELCAMIRERIKKLDRTYEAVITVDRDYTSTVY